MANAGTATVAHDADFVEDLGVLDLTAGIALTRVASGPAAGEYSVTVQTAANAITRSIELPIRVMAVPTGIPPPPVPPLPAGALEKFEKAMLVTASPNPGAARCDPAAPNQYPWSFGLEPQVWYYDGAWTYFKIADYTGDERWKACAFSIADAYQAYVMTTSVPGWRVFTQGQRRAYELTGDPKYLAAVKRLAGSGSAYGILGGDPNDLVIRETAYALRALTDAHLMGLQTDPATLQRSLNWLLGDFETLFSGPPETSNAQAHQLFMDGLGAQALTYYYDNWAQDPRIPVAVKKMADWTWRYGWDDAGGKLLWSPFAENLAYPRHCDSGCGVYTTQLIGLTQPVYYWLGRLLGDDSYRIQGDRMFAHITDTPAWSGKEFCQQFKDTITALMLRLGRLLPAPKPKVVLLFQQRPVRPAFALAA